MDSMPWMDGLPRIGILVDSDALDQRAAGGCPLDSDTLDNGRTGIVISPMEPDALDKRASGFPGVVILGGFGTLDERVGGCVSLWTPVPAMDGLLGAVLLVMDFDVLDERAAGYRPSLWTPTPWMNGFPGVVILADSNALDERWPGVVLRNKL
jgi:hypothetical protein